MARLRRRMLDAPRVYLDADASPITDRGDPHPVCRDARLHLVNPGHRTAHVVLRLEFRRDHSDAMGATLRLAGRPVELTVDEPTFVPADLPPGTTRATVEVRNPQIRCDNIEHNDLPTIAAHVVPRDA
jgi:hypothetical protein